MQGSKPVKPVVDLSGLEEPQAFKELRRFAAKDATFHLWHEPRAPESWK